jgi:hypothetical protein
MKIKLTRNTFVSGQSCSRGDVLEVSDAIGKQLLQIGKAVKVTAQADEAPIAAEADVAQTLQADATIETGPPAKVHKTRKKGL